MYTFEYLFFVCLLLVIFGNSLCSCVVVVAFAIDTHTHTRHEYVYTVEFNQAHCDDEWQDSARDILLNARPIFTKSKSLTKRKQYAFCYSFRGQSGVNDTQK